MSLVSEALKKARQEASRREATERGVLYPPVPHHLPVVRPARPAWPWAVGAAALAATLVGGTALLVVRRAPSAADPASGSPTGSPAVAAAASPAPMESAAPVAIPPPTAALPSPAAAPARAEPTSPRPTPRAATTAAVAPVPAATAPPASPIHPAAPAPPSMQTFVRHAELPDGTRLNLGGIAFSSGQPVALINGRALGPGEHVEGFLLARIEPDAVLLERDGLRLRLTLKE